MLLAAVAAALAYLLAAAVFGAHNAFFAPIAAVIIVGLSGGERFRRSIEVAGGVLVGVLAGELVALLALPVGAALAITVLLGMGAAAMLRPTSLFTNQAAVAGVVTMILTPVTQAPPMLRLGDALIGGVVAISVAVPALFRPEATLRSAVLAATDDLAHVLDDVHRGLADGVGDPDVPVREAVHAARHANALGDAYRQARESVRFGRRARRVASSLRRAALMRDEWLATTATAVWLARAARGLRRTETLGAARVSVPLDRLADAVREVGEWAGGIDGAPVARGETGTSADAEAVGLHVRRDLLALAAEVSAQLRSQTETSERVLLIAVRTLCVDLLRVTGMPHEAAVRAALP